MNGMKKACISLCAVMILFFNGMLVGQTTVLQEDFITYLGTAGSVPSGWTFTYNGCYTSTSYCGSSGPNSYKFGADQAGIMTPAFSTADSLHFWLRGVSTDATSSLAIEQSINGTTWTTVATINPLPTSGTNYGFAISNSTAYLRFTYTKSAGNVAFDDFLVTKNGGTPPASSHIKVFFNHPVNTSVSSGTNAVYLNGTVDDTLIAYINRAKYTIDAAVYNSTSSTEVDNIIDAINSAYSRGVTVRWIYEGTCTNSALSALNSGIKKLGRNDGVGIMHNKFFIFDANSSTASDAIVWTGSCNLSTAQFVDDYNNIIIVQDKPLAQNYWTEFNEMWGSTTANPNSSNAKFGSAKTDNTTHAFTIDGKTVELYFSPSDGTNTHIQSCINSANDDLFFAIYTFTDNTDATAIKTRIQSGGVYAAGIMDQYSQTYTPYTTLNPLMGTKLKVYSQSSLYHNKFLIVDACDINSDPQLLTGSHNWTISANTDNDENTLIIHDATVANEYYQSFYQNFYSLGGTLSSCIVTNNEDLSSTKNDIIVYPNPANDNMKIKNSFNVPAEISVFDMTGNIVTKEKANASSEINISTSSMNDGIYMIIMNINGNFQSEKIIIQH